MPSAGFDHIVTTNSNSYVTLYYDKIVISGDGATAYISNPRAVFTYNSGWTDSANSSSWGSALIASGSSGSYTYSGGASRTWNFSPISVSLSYSGPTKYRFSFTLTNVSFYSGDAASRVCNWDITFPQRVSTVGSVGAISTFDMGASVPLSWTRPDPNSTVTVRWAFGSASGTLLTKTTATSTTWATNLSTMANQVPNAQSGTGTVYADYYDINGNLVGTRTSTFTANVPSSVVPIAGTAVISEGMSNVATVLGTTGTGATTFVKSLSKISATYSGEEGVYSSTVSKVEFIIQGSTYTVSGGSWLSPFLGTVGSGVTLTKRVTDSRGRTADYVISGLTIQDYNAPSITSFSVLRTISGVQNPNGEQAELITTANSTELTNGGVQKNNIAWSVKARQNVASPQDWGTITPASSETLAVGITSISYDDTSDKIISGTYSMGSSYEFQLTVSDKFQSSTTLFIMATASVPFSISQTGIGAGKVWQQGAVDADGDIFASGNITASGAIDAGGDISASGDIATSGTMDAAIFTRSGTNLDDIYGTKTNADAGKTISDAANTELSYTPTVNGFSGGTIYGRYLKVGRLIHGYIEMYNVSCTLANPTVTLPAPVNTASWSAPNFLGNLTKNNLTGVYPLIAQIVSGDKITLGLYFPNGASSAIRVGKTYIGTMVSGDSLRITFTYYK